MDLFSLIDTSGFPPRWYCGKWSAAHGWTHVISDAAIFGAYTAIPIVIIYFALKRKEQINFHVLYLLFGLFIFACGITHLIEASIFWHPWYRLSGMMKIITALASWATVFAVIKIAPKALRLPGVMELNSKLERSNEELDKFAYIASHDLKAPLRAISNLASWIEEDTKEALPEKAKEHMATLQQRVTRMNTLLDDLLAFSRAGRTKDKVEPVTVEQVFENVNSLLDIPSNFSVKFNGTDQAFTTVRVPLEQVLRNLIQNSIKHHDKDTGEVSVEASCHGSFIHFIVKDDGPGIPDEFREAVFEMFRTLQPRDQTEGSGIGLAITKKIISSLGGTITLSDNHPRGTKIEFTWPLVIEDQNTF